MTVLSIGSDDFFKVQGITGNPVVYSWDEFLDLYTVEHNGWCAAGSKMTREQIDHFFQQFGRVPRLKWVIRLPIVKKITPKPSNVIPNTRDGIEQMRSLGLDVRELIGSSTELTFGTDDPEVHDKLFILKMCFA